MSGILASVSADTRLQAEVAVLASQLDTDAVQGLLLRTTEGPEALEPTAVAGWLTGFVDLPLVVEAGVGVHDPYNLARRVLSLRRIHSSRVSLLLTPGGIDPLTRAGRELAGRPGAPEGFAQPEEPSPSETWREYVRVVRSLFQSLPLSALDADQSSGDFAAAGALRPIAFEGDAYRVAGPLNAPLDDRGVPHVHARVDEDTSPSLLDAYIDQADALVGDLSHDAWERVRLRLQERRPPRDVQLLRVADTSFTTEGALR